MTFPEFIEQQQKWNNVFEPLIAGFQIDPLITGSSIEPIMKVLENREPINLVIPEKHLHLTLLALDELALKYGWVSDWGDLTPAETDDLFNQWSDSKLSAEEQEQIISKYFIDYYSDNHFEQIDADVRRWAENPIFNRRLVILKDSMAALKKSTKSFNPSNLVVPVLISQTDGIIGELIEREGWVYTGCVSKKGRKIKKWIHPSHSSENKPEKCFSDLIKNKRTRLGSTFIGNMVQTNSRYGIFMEGLFQQAFHGEGLTNPSFLSRHKILHGEDIEYGTLKNAIKLFLILNYLSKFTVSNLVEPDDSAFVEYRNLS
jgi:hypothetical protein